MLINGERVVIKSCQRKGNAMSDNDMKAELERLRSENAALLGGIAKRPNVCYLSHVPPSIPAMIP